MRGKRGKEEGRGRGRDRSLAPSALLSSLWAKLSGGLGNSED